MESITDPFIYSYIYDVILSDSQGICDFDFYTPLLFRSFVWSHSQSLTRGVGILVRHCPMDKKIDWIAFSKTDTWVFCFFFLAADF